MSTPQLIPLNIDIPSNHTCDRCVSGGTELTGQLLINADGRGSEVQVTYKNTHLGGESIQGEYGRVRRIVLRLLTEVEDAYGLHENSHLQSFKNLFQE